MPEKALRDRVGSFRALSRRGACAALVIAAMLGGLRAAEPDKSAPSADGSIDPPAGYLLIASAGIKDPRFQHSVILLVKHDRNGAFGIMINRLVTEEAIASLLANSDGKKGEPGADDKVDGKISIYYGGPVQPTLGFVVHSTDYHRDDTTDIDGSVAMTASRDILRDIGQQKGPQKYLFALGYAGWGAGQLEAEFARNDWLTAPEDTDLLFEIERSAVWERAVARQTRKL